MIIRVDTSDKERFEKYFEYRPFDVNAMFASYDIDESEFLSKDI